MNSKAGIIVGFAVGAIGFLALFKWFALPNIPREDELAPGIVMMMAMVNGFASAIVGHYLQRVLRGGSGNS